MSAVGRSFVAGQIAHMKELTLLFAPNINSYKRYVAGSLRPDRHQVGAGQPHLRVPAGRPRPGAAPGEPGARRRRQPVPRRRGDGRGRARRHRARAGARGRLDRQRLRRPTPSASPTRCASAARRCGRPATSPGERSATRSSTTTPTWPGSRSPRSTPPSPTGSASGGSSACEHDRRLAAARARTTSSTPRPSRSSARSRSPTSRRRTAAIDAAARAFPAWRARRARRPWPAAAPRSPTSSTRHLEELAQLEVLNAGPHDRQRPLGGGQRPRRPALLQRRRRSGCSASRSRSPAASNVTFKEPLGVVGGDRAVELPDADRRLGLRAGARRGQHRRAQARRADAADRDPARRAGAGGGAARGRVHRCSRARARWSGERFVTNPFVRKVVFTGSTEVGPADHGRLRRAGEAGDPRARRQERQHRLRRRRPRAGGGVGARRGLRQRRPGLLRPLADPRPAERVRPVHGAARAGRRRACASSDPALDDEPRWARSSRAGQRDTRGRRSSPTTRRSPSAAAPRRSRLLVPADGSRAGRTRRPVGDARRSSARSWSSCRSTTRPTRCGSPTTRRTACPARSGPATSAAPSGSRAASRPATCRSTRHSSVRYWTPFGGFKQSGLGRELGPDALDAFTETKNVFIATDSTALREARRMALDRLTDRVAVITGGGERHRPRHRAAASPPRARPSSSSTSTTRPARPRRRGRRALRARRRHQPRGRRAHLSRTAVRDYGRSTSPSTTPGSRRPTTTRSSTPAWTPGGGCRRSTSPRSTSCCKAAHPAHAAPGQGLDHQHGVVRRDAWARRPRRSPTPRPRAACSR